MENNIKNHKNDIERLENTIKQEERKFEFLFNKVYDSVFVHGISDNGFTKFEMVNDEACKVLGYKRSELLNMTPKDIDSNKFSEEFYLDKYKKLINNRQVKFETVHVTKAGKEITVENKSDLFEYKEKKLVLTVTRDITARKKKEKLLKKHYQSIKQKNNNLKTLNKRLNDLIDMIKELSIYSIRSEDEFLEKLFDTAFELIPVAEFGSVYKYKDGKVKFIKSRGHDIEFLNSLDLNVDSFNKAVGAKIIKNINLDLINELKGNPKIDNSDIDIEKHIKPIKESMTFTITSNEKFVGGACLDIAVESSGSFSEDSFNIFRALSTIGQTFYKIQNYDRLKGEFTKELALSLINMLEFHDEYTKGHSENVAILASDFAEYLELDQKTVSRVYWAGLVHDIGKIVIPSQILNKKGRLTAEEYEIIKEHPKWAYETLINSNQLADIAKYVLYHHERWDGKGYPEGLKDDQIFLISQILAIADSWDAMRSNRSYRDALTFDQAKKEVKTNKGKQYSPELADKFFEMLNFEDDKLFFS